VTAAKETLMPYGPGDHAAHRRDDDRPPALPLCGPEDLAVTVRWEQDGTGLRGQVTARNAGSRACRLAGKPGVTPLGLDGVPLPAGTVITLEMLHPGYVVLRPGQRAAAPVSWRNWCGQAASARARVSWQGGAAIADVQGPVQPQCSGQGADNLSSGWFKLID
jgi:hypothetical protein